MINEPFTIGGQPGQVIGFITLIHVSIPIMSFMPVMLLLATWKHHRMPGQQLFRAIHYHDYHDRSNHNTCSIDINRNVWWNKKQIWSLDRIHGKCSTNIRSKCKTHSLSKLTGSPLSTANILKTRSPNLTWMDLIINAILFIIPSNTHATLAFTCLEKHPDELLDDYLHCPKFTTLRTCLGFQGKALTAQ